MPGMAKSTRAAQAGITFGTAYYGDHWPEEQWGRDLDQIRSLGIEVVRFGEFSWSWFEPRPGEFRWELYGRFVDMAAERGLRMVLCTPTATPPPWFLKMFPDSRLMDADGHLCHAHRHYWCWNHRASRHQAERTIRALVSHFKLHKGVVAWQIDNEPNYAESTTLYDFNPAATADYRMWLREKYGDSLDALNSAWYCNFWSQRYGAWDEIGVLVPQRSNPHAWLDFARWREWNLGEMVRWQARLIREEDPAAVVGTNIPETGVKLSACIGQDYFDQARDLDWIGTDLYYATGDRAADVRFMRYSCDLMRSAAGKAEFIIAETQAGPHQRTWPSGFAAETWDAGYLRESIEAYAEHGARAVYFFLFRPTPGGNEIGMNGLTAGDGGPSERTRLVESLAPAGKQKKLLASRDRRARRPRALMHYSRDSIRFLQFWPASLELLQRSYSGWHRMLDEAGYAIDFISDEQLAGGAASEAKLLLLPQSHLMGDEAIAAVTGSDKRQRIILGPHTAMLDERGQLRQQQPGGALAAAAGVSLGFWYDLKVSAGIKGIKLPPITGYRDLTTNSNKSIAAEFRSLKAPPLKKPALIASGRFRWAAFDVGAVYDQSSAPGRTWLRRKFLG